MTTIVRTEWPVDFEAYESTQNFEDPNLRKKVVKMEFLRKTWDARMMGFCDPRLRRAPSLRPPGRRRQPEPGAEQGRQGCIPCSQR